MKKARTLEEIKKDVFKIVMNAFDKGGNKLIFTKEDETKLRKLAKEKIKLLCKNSS